MLRFTVEAHSCQKSSENRSALSWVELFMLAVLPSPLSSALMRTSKRAKILFFTLVGRTPLSRALFFVPSSNTFCGHTQYCVASAIRLYSDLKKNIHRRGHASICSDYLYGLYFKMVIRRWSSANYENKLMLEMSCHDINTSVIDWGNFSTCLSPQKKLCLKYDID